MIDKPALRRALRARRAAHVAALGPEARALAEAEVALRLLGAIEAAGAAMVAGYLPVGGELSVLPLLHALADRGIGTALPFVESREAPLRFLHWRPGEALENGPFGLVQPAATALPAEPALIVAPLVGFDRALGRLGQGAGHYDRAFAAWPQARRIGVGWSVQEVETLPQDPWDVPLHAIATEAGWIGGEQP